MNRLEALREIEEIVRNPRKPIASWKERFGAKVLGCLACMPPFAPEEWVHAAGMLPVGLWGAEIPVRLADAKLQSFACSVVRTSLELGLNGVASLCDGFLFPSTCDAFQNLSEVWKASLEKRCFEMTFPKRASGRAARRYLRRELERLEADLEGFSGFALDDSALGKTIRIYNENRRLMRSLDEARARDPGFLSARQMTELVLSSSFLPREEHSLLARALIEDRGAPAAPDVPPEGEGPVRVFLTGIMARPAAVSAALDELGVWVVGDDLGLGSLYYSIEIPEAEGCRDAIAEAYLRYPPCSTLYPSPPGRAAAVIRRARERRAEGVMILATKFCEPEFFDAPHLREDLETQGVPSLLLETELGMTAPGSVRTRVEAFVETLKEKRRRKGASGGGKVD
jgi:benzoyl-CoA reductase/2-hydroxyglutaryl-CoA dehydratase subunit BcrC/BadD/HgdB